ESLELGGEGAKEIRLDLSTAGTDSLRAEIQGNGAALGGGPNKFVAPGEIAKPEFRGAIFVDPLVDSGRKRLADRDHAARGGCDCKWAGQKRPKIAFGAPIQGVRFTHPRAAGNQDDVGPRPCAGTENQEGNKGQ